MSTREQEIASICESRGNQRSRLLDILMAIQHRDGYVDAEAIDLVATALSIPRVDVEGVVTFYAFLSREPRGRVTIRLCNDVVDRMQGAAEVAKALEEELGVASGETTPNGRFTLECVSCIGLSDQAPAALVNGVMLPRLGPDTAVRNVRALKESEALGDLRRILMRDCGDGNNAHDLVRAAVRNNVRAVGPVLLSDSKPRAGLDKEPSGHRCDVLLVVGLKAVVNGCTPSRSDSWVCRNAHPPGFSIYPLGWWQVNRGSVRSTA